MFSLLNPVDAENCPLVFLDRPNRWRLWQSPSENRVPGAVEDRVRRVFRLGATDPLPLVRRNALRDYHAHLAALLSFPFPASYCEEAEPLVLDGSVIVTGLCDPARTLLDSAMGILCEVVFRRNVRLPLALLKVEPWNPNSQFIDDYWHWFWNCR